MSDRSSLCSSPTTLPSACLDDDLPDPDTVIPASESNCGLLTVTLDCVIYQNLFPTDLKRVPERLDGELTLPLIDESQSQVAEKQHQFSPEEFQMITEENDKLLERCVIRPSKSPWAAQVVCLRITNGALRLCVNWRKLQSPRVLDTEGLGDISISSLPLEGNDTLHS